MIRSMTGYGRGETGGETQRFLIEIKSVNNRYLDVQVKAPRSLTALESRLKKSVQERFSRGRFDVFITRVGGEQTSGRLTVNRALAEDYVAALKELKERFGLHGEPDIATIASFPDVIAMSESAEDPAQLWQVLAAGMKQVLDDLETMRAGEGAALARDIVNRLSAITRLISGIRQKSPLIVERSRKRMTENLARLLNEQPDPVRIAQEIALLAERTDVTEELTRLDSHLAQFNALLGDESREGVGRKLDFLIQEIGREVNTIASKAMDADISLDVVEIKAELEKIREQVQNIE